MKVFLITCMTVLTLCGGCGDPYVPLTKVNDPKNTFELDFPLGGRVDDVLVYELSELNDPNFDKPAWAIENISKAISGRFRVTVPKVPKGFIQTIPSPPEQFELHEGQHYMILISYAGGATSLH